MVVAAIFSSLVITCSDSASRAELGSRSSVLVRCRVISRYHEMMGANYPQTVRSSLSRQETPLMMNTSSRFLGCIAGSLITLVVASAFPALMQLDRSSGTLPALQWTVAE